MTFFIAPNIFLLFFRDPEAKFTSERMKQVLHESGMAVTGIEQPFAVRWSNGDGPTLFVSIIRGKVAEVLGSRLLGKKHKDLDLIVGCDSYIEVTFESQDEVLDEMNTLIEVQSVLQEATEGLLYRSWNQSVSRPED